MIPLNEYVRIVLQLERNLNSLIRECGDCKNPEYKTRMEIMLRMRGNVTRLKCDLANGGHL